MARLKLLPGPRMLKTALSVTLSILLIRLFTKDTLSIFYAAFGALISMETTFSKSLRQGLTQLIGVLAGTLVGYVSVILFPDFVPAVFVGLGVLLLLFLSHRLNLSFTSSLACIIFLSVCLTPTDNVLHDSLFRLRDSSLGLGVALLVNALVRPYNNKKRIFSLLNQLRKQLFKDIELVISSEQIPDMGEAVNLLRRIDRELQLYHSQRFFHKKSDAEALLYGCKQLAERMVQELEAINGMDCRGNLSIENAEQLRLLGMELPQVNLVEQKCTKHDTIVMNYHLEKLLTAYSYLGALMEE